MRVSKLREIGHRCLILRVHLKRYRATVWYRKLSKWICGGIAQLGERLLCKQEVSGSIPLISTKGFTDADLQNAGL